MHVDDVTDLAPALNYSSGIMCRMNNFPTSRNDYPGRFESKKIVLILIF